MEKEEAMAVIRTSANSMSPQTIPRIFLESVERYGNRVAIRKKHLGLWVDISWNEYFSYVKNIALALVQMGFRKGDRVAIIGDNCPEWVMIDMAVICSGGISVGIYSTNSWDQCEYIINHSEVKFYFVENEEQLDKWLQFKNNAPSLEKVIVWDMKGLRDFKDPKLLPFETLIELGREEELAKPDLMKQLMSAVVPEDDAVFIYTSGTTGRPKGAVLTHSNASWIGEAIAKGDPLLETDEVLSYLPLCHIFERMFSVFAHIRHGYTLNFIENLDTIAENMIEVSPTVAYAVPRIWEKYYSMIIIKMSDATWFKRLLFNLAMKMGALYLKRAANETASFHITIGYKIAYFAIFRKLKERLGFDSLRLAFSGAAPISPDVISFFNTIGVNLLEGYGQTEGTGVTSVNTLKNAKIGTVGLPLYGVTIRIADDGEILVKSPGVFRRYFKDTESTRTTLIDGWLHSGDVGLIDQDGYLVITGRKKDIIITAGGKNITPQYVESKLVFSPYINDAIVIGDGRRYLTALIVLDEENTVKHAQDNRIQFATYQDLTRNPDIISLIEEEVNKANNDLSRVEQIKRFTIFPHKLYQEEGDVTPTMKVKRNYIQEKYLDLIEDMYR